MQNHFQNFLKCVIVVQEILLSCMFFPGGVLLEKQVSSTSATTKPALHSGPKITLVSGVTYLLDVNTPWRLIRPTTAAASR